MDESGLDEIDKMTKIISTVTRVMIRYRSFVNDLLFVPIVATSKSREMENGMKMIRAKRKGLLLLATRKVSMINSAM